MAKENKKFNYGLYAVSVFIVVAAVLVLITSLTFKSKYVAFDKEKVAVNFVDTVAQKGDGYNAYKFTLAAKSEKYGDFVRQQFMPDALGHHRFWTPCANPSEARMTELQNIRWGDDKDNSN